MQSLGSRILCKAYEVGFDFAFPPNNYNNKDDNDNDTHPNLAASHTCYIICLQRNTHFTFNIELTL